jgi:hypothetical protein
VFPESPFSVAGTEISRPADSSTLQELQLKADAATAVSKWVNLTPLASG